MNRYHVISLVSIGGVRHEPGAEIELSASEFLALHRAGCVEPIAARDRRLAADAKVRAILAGAEAERAKELALLEKAAAREAAAAEKAAEKQVKLDREDAAKQRDAEVAVEKARRSRR
jgi:hypothetical protein